MIKIIISLILVFFTLNVNATGIFNYQIPQPNLITDDWDGDGIPNHLDPDDDNDNIDDEMDDVPFGRPGVVHQHQK